jgi:hypothetical protein
MVCLKKVNGEDAESEVGPGDVDAVGIVVLIVIAVIV